MRVSAGDAFGSAIEAVRAFRWTEYAPFFWIFLVELLFLTLCTQLGSAWAMGIVAPLVKLIHGEGNLHYPGFFAYVSIAQGWLESFLYTVPGAVLIPLSLLRLYARSDRALSLGAGRASRLAGAFLPTLVAGALIVSTVLAWQYWAGRPVNEFFRGHLPAPFGDWIGWLTVTMGGYAVVALLLYVPVAAVQPRTNPVRAFGLGVRFGIRTWLLTLIYAALLGLPTIVVQWILERQGMLLLTRLRPESIVVFLVFYSFLTSVATYLTYATAARFYRIARGEE